MLVVLLRIMEMVEQKSAILRCSNNCFTRCLSTREYNYLKSDKTLSNATEEHLEHAH